MIKALRWFAFIMTMVVMVLSFWWFMLLIDPSGHVENFCYVTAGVFGSLGVATLITSIVAPLLDKLEVKMGGKSS